MNNICLDASILGILPQLYFRRNWLFPVGEYIVIREKELDKYFFIKYFAPVAEMD